MLYQPQLSVEINLMLSRDDLIYYTCDTIISFGLAYND